MYVSSYFIHLCFALKSDEVEAFCKGLKNLVFLTHSLGRHATRLNSLRDGLQRINLRIHAVGKHMLQK